MASRISVIILNWNGKHFLPECLESIHAQACKDFEVVMVDNGSTDGSPDFVRINYPWVTLVELPENVGFAEGNNRGLAVSSGEFIVTLNNDTVVVGDFLGAMVQSMEGNQSLGMIAAKMRNYYRRDAIDAIALKVARNGLGYNMGVGESDRGQYDTCQSVFGPCGGAAMYRRSMLDKIGFFDPDFFAYYEDFDLAWRARLAGWDCLTVPQSLVYHVHSATSGEMSPFKVYQTHRNKWYTIIKNWPAFLLLVSLPRILFYDLAAFVLALLHGRGWTALKARLDVLRHLGMLLRKRREIQQARRLDDDTIKGFFSAYESPLQTFTRKRKSSMGSQAANHLNGQ